jgi:UDP-N-acetylmuramoylalanine--D-glutamate ligase
MQEIFISSIKEKLDKSIRICVFGGGTTGLEVISFLKNHKKDFFLVDKNLESNEFPVFQDTESFESLPKFSLIIKSPGISPLHPLLLSAQKQGIPILSEIALARAFFTGKILGITGTDGKSTTTSLTHHILSSIHPKTKIGGNFGIPFVQFCEEKLDFAVLELSSYQLEDSIPLGLDSSSFLNLANDHLDRHKTMENYKNAKLRIVSKENKDHTFIYNERLKNDINTSGFLCKVKDFGTSSSCSARILVDEKKIVTHNFSYSIDEFPLLGFHNLENLAAAILLTESVDCSPELIQKSISNFKGLKYRFEKVHTYGDAVFINDSKSTNLHSLLSGIHGYTKDDRTVLLLGGRPKLEPIDDLVNKIKSLKPVKVFIYGEAGNVWRDSLSSIEVHIVPDPKSALEILYNEWKSLSPRYIIFSPGCASFDLYKNFEERGRIYTDLVKEVFC